MDGRFERVEKWKYVSHWVLDLEIVLLVLKEMKGERRGEALAWLQVLEEECWEDVASQQLEDAESLERVMASLNRERTMILAEKYKEAGKLEGRRQMLLELLETKFGGVSPEWKDRVENGDSRSVRLWARRVLEARRLEDLFRPEASPTSGN